MIDTARIMSDIDVLEIPSVLFTSAMITQLKLLIDIQINPRNNAATLGIPERKYYAISRYKNNYSNENLIDMYSFLTNLNYRLASGQLAFVEGNAEIDNDKSILNYIIINLLNFCKVQKLV